VFPLAALAIISIVCRGLARNTEPSFIKCRHVDYAEHGLVFIEKRNETPKGGPPGDETFGTVDRINYPRPGSDRRYTTVFLSCHAVGWISFRNHLANYGLGFTIRCCNWGAIPFVFD
ncbi:uncharacterized protein METZ01_LOCUS126982, partial [marine metagenome]